MVASRAVSFLKPAPCGLQFSKRGNKRARAAFESTRSGLETESSHTIATQSQDAPVKVLSSQKTQPTVELRSKKGRRISQPQEAESLKAQGQGPSEARDSHSQAEELSHDSCQDVKSGKTGCSYGSRGMSPALKRQADRNVQSLAVIMLLNPGRSAVDTALAYQKRQKSLTASKKLVSEETWQRNYLSNPSWIKKEEEQQQEEQQSSGAAEPEWAWLDGKTMWVAGVLGSRPHTQGGLKQDDKKRLCELWSYWEAGVSSPEQDKEGAALKRLVDEAAQVLGPEYDAADPTPQPSRGQGRRQSPEGVSQVQPRVPTPQLLQPSQQQQQQQQEQQQQQQSQRAQSIHPQPSDGNEKVSHAQQPSHQLPPQPTQQPPPQPIQQLPPPQLLQSSQQQQQQQQQQSQRAPSIHPQTSDGNEEHGHLGQQIEDDALEDLDRSLDMFDDLMGETPLFPQYAPVMTSPPLSTLPEQDRWHILVKRGEGSMSMGMFDDAAFKFCQAARACRRTGSGDLKLCLDKAAAAYYVHARVLQHRGQTWPALAVARLCQERARQAGNKRYMMWSAQTCADIHCMRAVQHSRPREYLSALEMLELGLQQALHGIPPGVSVASVERMLCQCAQVQQGTFMLHQTMCPSTFWPGNKEVERIMGRVTEVVADTKAQALSDGAALSPSVTPRLMALHQCAPVKAEPQVQAAAVKQEPVECPTPVKAGPCGSPLQVKSEPSPESKS